MAITFSCQDAVGSAALTKLSVGKILYSYRGTQRGYSSKPLNPFAPGDFAEKCVLKLVEWFSGLCLA